MEPRVLISVDAKSKAEALEALRIITERVKEHYPSFGHPVKERIEFSDGDVLKISSRAFEEKRDLQ